MGDRLRAYRWLEVAGRLGAKRMRVDAGGPEAMTDEILAEISKGYGDLVARGKDKGVEIVVENHWGSSLIPENLVRMLDATPGLGMLLDTCNWKGSIRRRGGGGWRRMRRRRILRAGPGGG